MEFGWAQFAVASFCAQAILVAGANGEQTAPLRVSPVAVSLDSPEATQQLLVTTDVAGRAKDLTHSVRYESSDPAIAVVTDDGRVQPRREGTTEIVIHHEGTIERLPVVVEGLTSPTAVSFRREVLPILSKSGCNSGGCHGKAEGQNGFKLSIFGFDAVADHDALVKEGRGRRVSMSAPDHSLLLLKGSAEVPHGGGARIEKGSLWYRRMARWIAEGARFDEESAPHVESIEVEPARIVMSAGATQQLRVTAIDSTGRRRCVTVEAEYHSNADEISVADSDGLVTVSSVPGEAAILVRFMGQVGVCRVTLPQPDIEFDRPPENNFVDAAVWDKLERLGIRPSELADDATFLRRVYLDTIGTLPTAREGREFIASDSPDKRRELIDHLLERSEYADYRALRWADILRVDKSIISAQGAVAMTRWLRRQFQENTPYDEFAREIVAASGNTLAESPAAFYQVHKDPPMLGRSISQVFLGVRIGCAECHHHPFERWSQHDYYAFAGFFTGVGRGGSPTGGQKIFSQAGSDLEHPRSLQPVPPAGLGAPPADLSDIRDRRIPLADWMTSPDNPFFARMIANRLWAHYFGRGLVEPIDDMRATNPATNEPLLSALAAHLVDVGFDLKALTRTLLNSRVYQLRSQPNETNATDEQNFSHATWKPMPAEVLLDAICQATDVTEHFNGWPDGQRAIRIWDNRMPSYFFRVFGRPQRVSVCECERGNEPSIAQALHLMNSPETVHKIRHRDGVARRLAMSNQSSPEIINELYLTTLSRVPTDEEIALMQQAFDESADDRRSAVEDVLWTLLNTREFVYNH
ncbi:MAG: DUF1549 domain-containing protein [Planctomycetaceae bacterium]